MRPGFRVLPHTAEVALEVRGRDWAEFYANAARGLMAVYRPAKRSKGTRGKTCRIAGDGPEEVLAAWLNEIIYLVAAKRWLPARFAVRKADEKSLTARLEGAPLPGPGILATEIKAATYNDLKVSQYRGNLKARIVLDV